MVFIPTGFEHVLTSPGRVLFGDRIFPPSIDKVTVSVVSTSLNIVQRSTKLFPKYSRYVVHLHKYDVNQRILIDFRCPGQASSPAQGVGHLIVYGIREQKNDEGSAFYDALYVVDKSKMVMQMLPATEGEVEVAHIQDHTSQTYKAIWRTRRTSCVQVEKF